MYNLETTTHEPFKSWMFAKEEVRLAPRLSLENMRSDLIKLLTYCTPAMQDTATYLDALDGVEVQNVSDELHTT